MIKSTYKSNVLLKVQNRFIEVLSRLGFFGGGLSITNKFVFRDEFLLSFLEY